MQVLLNGISRAHWVKWLTVTLQASSGNEAFDRSAMLAVRKGRTLYRAGQSPRNLSVISASLRSCSGPKT